MKLSQRLQAAADMVLPGKPVADIGTDHCFLPLYLVEENRCPFVIASDRSSVLTQASVAAVRERELENSISVRAGDGFSVLEEGEVGTACLCGMGGLTIIDILTAAGKKLATVERLVLQPQRDVAKVRGFLAEKGWQIVAEQLVFEDGFFYELLAAQKGQMQLSELDKFAGPLLLSNGHPLLPGFLENKQRKLLALTEVLKEKNTKTSQERLFSVKKELCLIREALSIISAN